jgi:hypothetical protein
VGGWQPSRANEVKGERLFKCSPNGRDAVEINIPPRIGDDSWKESIW